MVERPCDAALIPDGAALSAYQYFENVRNFLVAVNELGIPSFEASDMGQVGVPPAICNMNAKLKKFQFCLIVKFLFCFLAFMSMTKFGNFSGRGVF